eukprot:gnl/MRDRNA2_/MRDRNA2_123767_c0_seq1.p1 gnl/MRDRNA2_/MRDRNA2_123767_c0~~gnl/MRDRNA2_/MRDRNA2_123767_c0_seq1.p1  ORF type:complete len:911 (-),score=252.73 gnl/MRDRNA2_/MRDRNA2_123767_c0_seq1:97-2766(-)
MVAPDLEELQLLRVTVEEQRQQLVQCSEIGSSLLEARSELEEELEVTRSALLQQNEALRSKDLETKKLLVEQQELNQDLQGSQQLARDLAAQLQEYRSRPSLNDDSESPSAWSPPRRKSFFKSPEHQDLEQQFGAANEEIDDLHRQVEDLQQKLQSSSSIRQEQHDRCEAAQADERVQNLRRKYALSTVRCWKLLSKKNHQLHRLSSESRTLLEEKLQNVQAHLEEVEAEYDDVNARNLELSTQLGSLQEHCRELHKASQDLETALQAEKDEKVFLLERIQSLEDDLKNSHMGEKQQRQEKERLIEKLQALGEDNDQSDSDDDATASETDLPTDTSGNRRRSSVGVTVTKRRSSLFEEFGELSENNVQSSSTEAISLINEKKKLSKALSKISEVTSKGDSDSDDLLANPDDVAVGRASTGSTEDPRVERLLKLKEDFKSQESAIADLNRTLAKAKRDTKFLRVRKDRELREMYEKFNRLQAKMDRQKGDYEKKLLRTGREMEEIKQGARRVTIGGLSTEGPGAEQEGQAEGARHSLFGFMTHLVAETGSETQSQEPFQTPPPPPPSHATPSRRMSAPSHAASGISYHREAPGKGAILEFNLGSAQMEVGLRESVVVTAEAVSAAASAAANLLPTSIDDQDQNLSHEVPSSVQAKPSSKRPASHAEVESMPPPPPAHLEPTPPPPPPLPPSQKTQEPPPPPSIHPSVPESANETSFSFMNFMTRMVASDEEENQQNSKEQAEISNRRLSRRRPSNEAQHCYTGNVAKRSTAMQNQESQQHHEEQTQVEQRRTSRRVAATEAHHSYTHRVPQRTTKVSESKVQQSPRSKPVGAAEELEESPSISMMGFASKLVEPVEGESKKSISSWESSTSSPRERLKARRDQLLSRNSF